jgi:hypothetical protein
MAGRADRRARGVSGPGDRRGIGQLGPSDQVMIDGPPAVFYLWPGPMGGNPNRGSGGAGAHLGLQQVGREVAEQRRSSGRPRGWFWRGNLGSGASTPPAMVRTGAR